MMNGPVQVGYAFECMKKNGKGYDGEVMKVAAYPRGTLVTIRYFSTEDHHDDFTGRTVKVQNPVYKSIYLEDCSAWVTREFV